MIKFNLAKLENHLAFQILDISNGYLKTIMFGDHIIYISEVGYSHLSLSNMDFRRPSHKIHYPMRGTAHLLMFNDNLERDKLYNIILDSLSND